MHSALANAACAVMALTLGGATSVAGEENLDPNFNIVQVSTEHVGHAALLLSTGLAAVVVATTPAEIGVVGILSLLATTTSLAFSVAELTGGVSALALYASGDTKSATHVLELLETDFDRAKSYASISGVLAAMTCSLARCDAAGMHAGVVYGSAIESWVLAFVGVSETGDRTDAPTLLSLLDSIVGKFEAIVSAGKQDVQQKPVVRQDRAASTPDERSINAQEVNVNDDSFERIGNGDPFPNDQDNEWDEEFEFTPGPAVGGSSSGSGKLKKTRAIEAPQ